MTELEKKVLSELQKGLKLETRPFKRIADICNISENEVLTIIKNNISNGIIRRMGVGLKPNKLGFKENALVAFEVKPELVDSVGNFLSNLKEVSHCYERECPPDWNYNLFAMIHAESEEELNTVIDNIIKQFGITNFKIFKTKQELKKSSVRYF